MKLINFIGYCIEYNIDNCPYGRTYAIVLCIILAAWLNYVASGIVRVLVRDIRNGSLQKFCKRNLSLLRKTMTKVLYKIITFFYREK